MRAHETEEKAPCVLRTRNHIYSEIGRGVGTLVSEKQAAYGDAFGKSEKILQILYPQGILPKDYDNLLTLVRVIDKLFRVATDKDAFGENPWRDICGYAILALSKNSEPSPMEE